MGYYITSMRAAAEKAEPQELKAVFDYYMELALEDYKSGALDVLEYGQICFEYADTLTAKGVLNYM